MQGNEEEEVRENMGGHMRGRMSMGELLVLDNYLLCTKQLKDHSTGVGGGGKDEGWGEAYGIETHSLQK